MEFGGGWFFFNWNRNHIFVLYDGIFCFAVCCNLFAPRFSFGLAVSRVAVYAGHDLGKAIQGVGSVHFDILAVP